MKKKILSIILMLVLIPTVAIAGTASEQITVQKNVATVTVNGEKVAADNFVYNGTTYVPLRAVSENLGATVDWDNATKTAKINSQANSSDISDKIGNTFLYYNLYKKSAETKDMTNAIAIHFLTSTGDMSTLKNVQPISKQLVEDLKKSEETYKNIGGDIYTAYQLVQINASRLHAVVEASISYNVTSATSNTNTALDNCEEILDECDKNNEYIHILIVEDLTK